jgi:hypothetical protein
MPTSLEYVERNSRVPPVHVRLVHPHWVGLGVSIDTALDTVRRCRMKMISKLKKRVMA